MLNAYPADLADGSSQPGWIDLVDPTPEERASFESTFGLRVPAKDELGEIEATSRLQSDKGAVYMTAPLILAMEGQPWISSPAGFVLSKQVLLTIRSGKSAA